MAGWLRSLVAALKDDCFPELQRLSQPVTPVPSSGLCGTCPQALLHGEGKGEEDTHAYKKIISFQKPQ